MNKRFIFIVVLGLMFAPAALAGSSVGENNLANTNMAGVRCGEAFKVKNLKEATQSVSDQRASAGKAGVAR